MNQYGFIKVCAASVFGKPADIDCNCTEIINTAKKASDDGCSVIVFPELSITSYTCQDLFLMQNLQKAALDGLLKIKRETRDLPIVIIVGLPLVKGNNLYNCAAVLCKGKILGIVPKSNIPNYHEFYERRWFTPANIGYFQTITIEKEEIPFSSELVFQNEDSSLFSFGIEIGEDLWSVIPPSCKMANNGALMFFNLSASDITAAKNDYCYDLVKMQSAKLYAGYVYCNASAAESTSDMVFDGKCLIFENGKCLAENESLGLGKTSVIYGEIDLQRLNTQRLQNNNTCMVENADKYKIFFRLENKNFIQERVEYCHPFIPADKNALSRRCEEILSIQSVALARRLETLRYPKVVIGLSGGLDSTLALLVSLRAVKLLGLSPETGILPLTMPGFGTTQMTLGAVKELCTILGFSNLREVDIKDVCTKMFDMINHNPQDYDVTYENVQARARTYVLMSTANKENGIVVGTGDLSEIALGWSTYNGDHMSMYNVNCGVPKTLIQFLIHYEALRPGNEQMKETLQKIVDFPISPELLPPGADGKEILQKTEEKIGPYELHDFFLYYFVRFGFTPEKILYLATAAFKEKYSADEIKKWLVIFVKRFFTSQWKRDCVPDGPKIGSVDLSPRGSWRMSCESSVKDFLKGLE